MNSHASPYAPTINASTRPQPRLVLDGAWGVRQTTFAEERCRAILAINKRIGHLPVLSEVTGVFPCL